jgi:hypothetical protein
MDVSYLPPHKRSTTPAGVVQAPGSGWGEKMQHRDITRNKFFKTTITVAGAPLP